MALTDEVQGRYSTQLLVNASNPQNSGATTIDTTRLSYACTDVTAEFTKRGITYDNTVATHVATAVPGVYARLLVMTGQSGDELWQRFMDDLQLLSETTSRDRIMPTTDSLLEATEDTSGDLPASDRKNMEGYIPDGASGSTANS